MKYILFNPLANNKQGEKPVKEIESKLKDNYTTKSLIDISIKDFFSSLKEMISLEMLIKIMKISSY